MFSDRRRRESIRAWSCWGCWSVAKRRRTGDDRLLGDADRFAGASPTAEITANGFFLITANPSLVPQFGRVGREGGGVGRIVGVVGIDLNEVRAESNAGVKRLRERPAEIVMAEALRGSEEL